MVAAARVEAKEVVARVVGPVGTEAAEGSACAACGGCEKRDSNTRPQQAPAGQRTRWLESNDTY